MSKETLDQFIQQISDSEELQARVGEEIDSDSLIALGAEHGCEFSAEDLQESAELSDEELDSVAGGGKAERKERKVARKIKRLEKAANEVSKSKVVWLEVEGAPQTNTQVWDDGSGDPTKVN